MAADDDQYTDEETERRAHKAIRRSFQTPHKPHREMVGKTASPVPRKRSSSKAAKKPK